MARRRRRNRATWFPVVPTVFGDGDPKIWFQDEETITASEVSGGEGTTLFTTSIPLTLDQTQNVNTAASDPGSSLRDYVEGQDWLCQRVVGKFWGLIGQNESSPLQSVILTLAMAVLPADASGGADLSITQWNPMLAQNAQQPYMFRRTWILYNNSFTYGGGTVFTGPTNVANTSAGTFDAGHIDTRGTMRRIRKDQRLFLLVACDLIEGNPDATELGVIRWGYDLRILGGMRRGKNASSF